MESGVLWRHDIDVSPHRALAQARIEHGEGVCATYFVWLHSPFYNALEVEVVERLREIDALGHEVGLHFDPAFYGLRPDHRAESDRRMREESAILESLLGHPIWSVALHNPGVCGWQDVEDDDLAGLVHATGRSIRSRFTYCSDSGGRWRFQQLEDVLRGGAPRLQVLTHPEWWVPEAMAPRERIARAIDGRAARASRRYDDEIATMTAAVEDAQPALSIVIPAYNEGANVTAVVEETHRVLAENTWVDSYEIVLVDDGSRDDTGRIMDALASDRRVVVVHHEVNRGFGAALKTGFTRSRGRYVTLITGDGEIGVDQALNLYRDMGDADLMISTRERTVAVDRKILTAVATLLSHLILGVTGGTNGIYVVRGEMLRRMHLVSDTGLANLEVYLQIVEWGGRIRSGVTRTRPRLSGHSKVTNVSTSSKILLEMIKLRLARRRARATAPSA